MNLNINAHIGHRINIEETVCQVREVTGIVPSTRPNAPVGTVLVAVSDLVLSEGPDETAKAGLYCRDCDLFLVGNWEYA